LDYSRMFALSRYRVGKSERACVDARRMARYC
jgi:hypothetical protein